MTGFSTDLPADDLEQFSAWVQTHGYVKWRAVAAALRVLQCSPRELREAAIARDWKSVEEWFARHAPSPKNQEGRP